MECLISAIDGENSEGVLEELQHRYVPSKYSESPAGDEGADSESQLEKIVA